MNSRLVAWGGRTVMVATLLLAGSHFVYYLYHWEWVRAQIAGLVLIATLVVAAARLLLARVDRMQRDVGRRLDAMAAAVADRSVAGPPGRADGLRPRVAGDEPDFSWLARELSPPRHRAVLSLVLLGGIDSGAGAPQAAVFIPILLGAGLAVSAVAGVVERTAATVHGGGGGPWRGRQLLLGGAAAVALVAVATTAIWFTAHYRPTPFSAGVTELTVQVSTKTWPRPAEQTVEAIGRYCALNAIAGVTVEQVRPATSESAVLVVSPVLDEQAQRRYSGCLQDANLERHRLTVTDTVRVPG